VPAPISLSPHPAAVAVDDARHRRQPIPDPRNRSVNEGAGTRRKLVPYEHVEARAIVPHEVHVRPARQRPNSMRATSRRLVTSGVPEQVLQGDPEERFVSQAHDRRLHEKLGPSLRMEHLSPR